MQKKNLKKSTKILHNFLPIAIFALVSVLFFAFLFWFGMRSTFIIEVDLGGGIAIETIFPPDNPSSNLPPILPPPDFEPPNHTLPDNPHEKPNQELPDNGTDDGYDDYDNGMDDGYDDYDDDYDNNNKEEPLPPIPVYLLHNIYYTAFAGSFGMIFDTQTRTTDFIFIREGQTFVLNATFMVIGTNRLSVEVLLSDVDNIKTISFTVDVLLGSVTIQGQDFLDYIGYVNPFAPDALTLHADWLG